MFRIIFFEIFTYSEPALNPFCLFFHLLEIIMERFGSGAVRRSETPEIENYKRFNNHFLQSKQRNWQIETIEQKT